MNERRGRTTVAATVALIVGLAAGGGVAWNVKPNPPPVVIPIRTPVPEVREVPVEIRVPVVLPSALTCPEPERCVTVAVEWGGMEQHAVCRDRWTWIADAAGMRREEKR